MSLFFTAPERRSSFDGEIYFFPTNNSETRLFDPSLGRWESLGETSPHNKHGAGYAISDNAVYITWTDYDPFGGGRIADHMRWDRNTGQFEILPDPPTVWLDPMMAFVDGTLYLMGGMNPDNRNLPQPDVFGYDVSSGTWSQKTDMPEAVRYSTNQVVDSLGHIHLIGGEGNADPNQKVVRTHQVYDPVADSWELKEPLPVKLLRVNAEVGPDDKIYATAPDGENYSSNNRLDIYDPDTDSWSSGATPTPSLNGEDSTTVFGTDGILYVAAPDNDNKLVISYDPTTDTWADSGTTTPVSATGSPFVGQASTAFGGSSPFLLGATHDFEDQSTEGWEIFDSASNGSFNISSAQSRSGSYSLRHDGTFGDGALHAIVESQPAIFSSYNYWTSFSGSAYPSISLFNNNDRVDVIRINHETDGEVHVSQTNATDTADNYYTGVTVPLNTWLLYELQNIDWVNEEFTLFVEDTSGTTYINQTIPFSWTGRFGDLTKVDHADAVFYSTWDNTDAYLDDIFLND